MRPIRSGFLGLLGVSPQSSGPIETYWAYWGDQVGLLGLSGQYGGTFWPIGPIGPIRPAYWVHHADLANRVGLLGQ